MKKISIAVIEDHQLIRQMWVQLFSDKPELEVTGESGSLAQAVEMVKIKRPDIALLDINLPDASGMDAVPLIRKYTPGTKIIAVSMHNQPAYARKMLQLGAKGYVTKNSPPQEIYDAIDEVMNGRVYICTEIKNLLSEQFIQDETQKADIKDLSMREIEIVKLLKEGLSSKEIAAKLNIAARTVEVHRHNILRKLNLKNTASLITFINTTDLYF